MRFIDPLGLTQADIDNAFNTAKTMTPDWNHPTSIGTWSQQGKAGRYGFFDKDIKVDSKYLECLDDGEAGALLMTILHEMKHFNQSWYEFAFDNIQERLTGGNFSSAQDAAEKLLWENDGELIKYMKNRNLGIASCRCRK